MSLSAKIAPHLPFLRRFARAVSGSQPSGDALVAAMLEAIIADISIFPEASNERIALYKLFAKLFTSIAIRVPHETARLGLGAARLGQSGVAGAAPAPGLPAGRGRRLHRRGGRRNPRCDRSRVRRL